MFDLIIFAVDPATSLETRRFAGEYRQLAICEAEGKAYVRKHSPPISPAVVRPWVLRFECKPKQTTRTDMQLVVFRFTDGVQQVERQPVFFPTGEACTAAGNAARAQHKAAVDRGVTPSNVIVSFRCEPVKRGQIQT